MPYINKTADPRDLTIFMISFISSFEITSEIHVWTKIFFFWVAESADDVDPNGIKTLLAMILKHFLLKARHFKWSS